MRRETSSTRRERIEGAAGACSVRIGRSAPAPREGSRAPREHVDGTAGRCSERGGRVARALWEGLMTPRESIEVAAGACSRQGGKVARAPREGQGRLGRASRMLRESAHDCVRQVRGRRALLQLGSAQEAMLVVPPEQLRRRPIPGISRLLNPPLHLIVGLSVVELLFELPADLEPIVRCDGYVSGVE